MLIRIQTDLDLPTALAVCAIAEENRTSEVVYLNQRYRIHADSGVLFVDKL